MRAARTAGVVSAFAVVATIDLSPQLTTSQIRLQVGVAYVEATTGTWRVYVDDVVVDPS